MSNSTVFTNYQLQEDVFRFIYGCAMHDAILQKAFKGKKDWVERIREEHRKPLRNYIDILFHEGFESQKAHDDCFLETSNRICNSLNNIILSEDAGDVFSFGNAQKLINMSVKHCYITCYFKKDLRDNFKYCHCPLDSIMLKRVWKDYCDKYNKSERKANLGNGTDFCKSWGDEGLKNSEQPKLSDLPDRYKKYQFAVREIIKKSDIYPIEYDYLAWKQ